MQEINQKEKIFKIKELISVENSTELLRFRFECDNMLMWPFVRHILMQGAVNNFFSLENPHAKNEKQSLIAVLKYAYLTLVKNPFCINKRSHTDILFFSSGIVNVKEGDKYVNRLYDHFAFEYPDRTLIIEDSCRRRYYLPRSFPKVFYHDLIPLLAFLDGRIKKISLKDKNSIENLILYLKENFSYKFKPDFWKDLGGHLSKLSTQLPGLHRRYLRLLRKICPKIIFLEDANYGRRSYIIKWAKDLGITTAEIQHGAILQEHPAYNYGDAIFNSDYLNYLPDFYLSNGKFWNDSLKTPSKTINIGNPYLSSRLNGIHKNMSRDNRYKLLIISAGTAPEILMKLVENLESILPSQDFSLIFRPHPSEIPFVGFRYKSIANKGIEFDSGNFYETLHRVDGILSAEFSTAIFEAAVFGKDIFIFNSPIFTYHFSNGIFNYFSTAEELYKIIYSQNKIKCDSKIFLDGDWRRNYRKFINSVVYGQDGR